MLRVLISCANAETTRLNGMLTTCAGCALADAEYGSLEPSRVWFWQTVNVTGYDGDRPRQTRRRRVKACRRDHIGIQMLAPQCQRDCTDGDKRYDACTYQDGGGITGVCTGWFERRPGACQNDNDAKFTVRWRNCSTPPQSNATNAAVPAPARTSPSQLSQSLDSCKVKGSIVSCSTGQGACPRVRLSMRPFVMLISCKL